MGAVGTEASRTHTQLSLVLEGQQLAKFISAPYTSSVEGSLSVHRRIGLKRHVKKQNIDVQSHKCEIQG